MTKPVIVVKIPCKLLYEVKEFLKCLTSWPYLISSFWLLTIAASYWPRTFLQPGCLYIHAYILCIHTYIYTYTQTYIYVFTYMYIKYIHIHSMYVYQCMYITYVRT